MRHTYRGLKKLAYLPLALVLLGVPIALAQVPPHNPGEICFTEQFWCWAEYPGPPGEYCECYWDGYYYQGVLG